MIIKNFIKEITNLNNISLMIMSCISYSFSFALLSYLGLSYYPSLIIGAVICCVVWIIEELVLNKLNVTNTKDKLLVLVCSIILYVVCYILVKKLFNYNINDDVIYNVSYCLIYFLSVSISLYKKDKKSKDKGDTK